MALDYSFEIASSASAADLAAAVSAARAETFEHSASDLRAGATTRNGAHVKADDMGESPFDDVAESFGFQPTVRVTFRLNKFTDLAAQYKDISVVVSAILRGFPGDAILYVADGDSEIWLLRQNNDLMMHENDEWDYWPPERLAEISVPYRWRTRHWPE